jgi:hypothetical protein
MKVGGHTPRLGLGEGKAYIHCGQRQTMACEGELLSQFGSSPTNMGRIMTAIHKHTGPLTLKRHRSPRRFSRLTWSRVKNRSTAMLIAVSGIALAGAAAAIGPYASGQPPS